MSQLENFKKPYKLEDFEAYYQWLLIYKKEYYVIDYIGNKNYTWVAYKENHPGPSFKTENLNQAKAWLSAQYGIPSKGWKTYDVMWTSEDGQWTLWKTAKGKWAVHVNQDDHQVKVEIFNTREIAINWINQWEKDND